MLSGLSFAAPMALFALAGLPLLWWLLRVTPPAPRKLVFPAIRLLAGLPSQQRSAQRTPLWLMILRMMLAVCLIVGLAHPMWDAVRAPLDGPSLLVVDNGWASGKNWPLVKDQMERVLSEAERQGRAVSILSVAPGANGEKIAPTSLLPAVEARSLIGALSPNPWQADHGAALKSLDQLPPKPAYNVTFLADGIGQPETRAFIVALHRLGALQIFAPDEEMRAKFLEEPRRDETGRIALQINRMGADKPGSASLLAVDSAGFVLSRENAAFAIGEQSTKIYLSVPTEQRNRIARLTLEGENTAASVVLMDDGFRRHPVGLVDRSDNRNASPLLDDLYYVERALGPMADLRRDSLSELLKRPLSLIVLADEGKLSEQDQNRLRQWVQEGGVLLRLGGPKLAASPDQLLPVRLLSGGRTFGGAMSWTTPVGLAEMPEKSPFAGLAIPPGLTIGAQVLAEPSLDLAEKSWARLSDGTPLATGASLGKGWLVLIHTTIGPEWSNLGMSGLFPEMLGRLLLLSQGGQAMISDKALPPYALLDGLGRLGAPIGAAEALAMDRPKPIPSPRHPPGYYGTDSMRIAFNLSPSLADVQPISMPGGVKVAAFGANEEERDLRAPFLLAALALLLIDMAALAWLKGAVFRRALPSFLVFALLGGFFLASGVGPLAAAADEEKARQAALETRLAYVITGDRAIDDVSLAGLTGLSRILAWRTMAELEAPHGIRLSDDELSLYPLLYWPIGDQQPALTEAEREKVNDYLRRGGMILFDSGDGKSGSNVNLTRIAGGLDIPALKPLTPEHVLSRSYYILNEYPGRWATGTVYVEDGGDPGRDLVSPVVIGSNGWAAAWALDARGKPMFAAVPGGERQREMAYRFGVNLAIYALTGSYKADQVHLPAILERMRK